MRALGAIQHLANVGDAAAAGIQRDVLRRPGRAQGQRHRQARCLMRGDERFQWQCRKYVAVVHQYRFFPHPCGDVFKPTARFQQNRFVKQRRLVCWPEVIPRLRQMVGIDRKARDPSLGTGLHRPLRQRAVEQRHQRLGQALRQRTQAIPHSRTEDKGLVHTVFLKHRRR